MTNVKIRNRKCKGVVAPKAATINDLTKILTTLEVAYPRPLIKSDIAQFAFGTSDKRKFKSGLNWLCNHGLIEKIWVEYEKKGKGKSKYPFHTYAYLLKRGKGDETN